MLFQRRDDDVPIFLLKPIKEIRRILDEKTEDIKRGVSPSPQATSVLMDKRSRSASPNVGKRETRKETTAKVPEIKESTKEEEGDVKIEKPVENTLKASSSQPIIVGEHNEKEDTVTIQKESTPVKVDSTEVNQQKVTEKAQVVAEPQPQQPNITPPPPIIITQEAPTQPTILVNDEDNNEVKAEVVSPQSDDSKNTQEKSELISASSSILEIIEEIVAVDDKVDENNNTPKNEEPNDNSDPVKVM